ncbi:polyprenyl synthetase family protein [bacterium]|nr:polyprenyl synthetase family protein [Flavobacteriales bacterium]MBT6650309.1 polyprenyl synthetase family protein [Flavobacteriales bacterium]MBT6964759.1 polyprenyl synthetase family protein [Flavobacteriales bacterium]MDB3870670.1 polyprenyl synthetase family protein [bacterium]
MSIIKDIKAPIKLEMDLFENKFKDSLKSNVSLLDRIMHYIIKRKGKQMRPMFVFLTAKLFGKFEENTYRAASMIELLHTATLVHDDVIDKADFRRGYFSINALWKNKIAVLVGDFLLSRGLLLAVKHEEFELLKIMSTAVQDMSEGELLQIEKARKLDITEKVYFDIIRKKTATLIAACCASGANSVGEDKNTVETMRLFGEKAGIAFQIKDDLFDYTQSTFIGKPTGIDIREQKMTLPLIYTLNNVSKKEKNNIINIVKNHHENDKKVAELIELVKENGGLNYAEDVMIEYRNEALEILNQFDDNEARRSLELLLNYVVNRKK